MNWVSLIVLLPSVLHGPVSKYGSNVFTQLGQQDLVSHGFPGPVNFENEVSGNGLLWERGPNNV